MPAFSSTTFADALDQAEVTDTILDQAPNDDAVQKTFVRQGVIGGLYGLSAGVLVGLGPLLAALTAAGGAFGIVRVQHPEADTPPGQFIWIGTTAAIGAFVGQVLRD